MRTTHHWAGARGLTRSALARRNQCPCERRRRAQIATAHKRVHATSTESPSPGKKQRISTGCSAPPSRPPTARTGPCSLPSLKLGKRRPLRSHSQPPSKRAACGRRRRRRHLASRQQTARCRAPGRRTARSPALPGFSSLAPQPQQGPHVMGSPVRTALPKRDRPAAKQSDEVAPERLRSAEESHWSRAAPLADQSHHLHRVEQKHAHSGPPGGPQLTQPGRQAGHGT